jgi:hypothetical protein
MVHTRAITPKIRKIVSMQVSPLLATIGPTTVTTQPLVTSPPARPLHPYVTLLRDSEGYAEVLERYATWAAARQGHARWVRQLQAAD